MSYQSTINFKIDHSLKNDFLHICQREGYSASLIMREFIKDYCSSHKAEEPVPNEETLQAMKDAINSTNTTVSSFDDFLKWAKNEAS